MIRKAFSMVFHGMRRLGLYAFLFFVLALLWARLFQISTTPYMWQEAHRLGEVKYQWVALENLPHHIASSMMAGEDAGFCAHSGIEWGILWEITKEGGKRGGSTISQQMVKNLWLWHGRGFVSRALRKGIEIPLTLIVELVYPKARIMEIYLNIIEFDEGVFGIEAAAWHHYGHEAAVLSRQEAARLASVLPNPAAYQAVPPDAYVLRRSAQIAKGAEDIEALELDSCLY